jgi:hypothetical protein
MYRSIATHLYELVCSVSQMKAIVQAVQKLAICKIETQSMVQAISMRGLFHDIPLLLYIVIESNFQISPIYNRRIGTQTVTLCPE